MNIQFDEKNIKTLSQKYRTDVQVYDFVGKINVYSGPLDRAFLDILQMYVEEKYLPDDFKWVVVENSENDGITHIVQKAVDANGKRILGIDLKMDKKVTSVRLGSNTPLLLGLVSGFLGWSFWETIVIWLLLKKTKGKE